MVSISKQAGFDLLQIMRRVNIEKYVVVFGKNNRLPLMALKLTINLTFTSVKVFGEISQQTSVHKTEHRLQAVAVMCTHQR